VLGRNLQFAVSVILTLALGIGVCASAFSVVDSVLLRPLAYPAAERLVWLADYDQWSRQDTMGSRADFEVLRRESRSFAQMAAYGSQDFTVVADGEASQERITSVAGDFWAITGTKPEVGRLFQEGQTGEIVLAHHFAARRFPAEDDLIGKAVLVNERSFVVVGVLPEGFRFDFPQLLPTSAERKQPDAYIPIPPGAEQPGAPIPRELDPAPVWVSVVGKLKPGVDLREARAEMTAIHARVSQQFPSPTRGELLRVLPLAEKIAGEVRKALLTLFAAAAFVLLIAASNVSNLLVVQATKRRQEFAVRRAIGAGTGRLARQRLAEGMVLAFISGAVGIAIANWMTGLVIRLGAESVPRLAETRIDGGVLAFVLVLAVLSAFGFTLASGSSTATRGDSGLASTSRSSSDTVGVCRLRNVLVAGQLALALVLLSGAGLMIKSFWRMSERPPGFAPNNILSMQVPLSGQRYGSWLAKDAYIRRLIERLQSSPGIEAAGVDTGTLNTSIGVVGSQEGSETTSSVVAARMVSPGYLRAIGTPLRQGRWPDRDEELDAVLVNETFARRSGHGDLVGKRVAGAFLPGTIVGVVADFKHSRLDAPARPEVYYSYRLAPSVGSVRVLSRANDSSIVAASIREIARDIDPGQPIYRFATLEELLADSIAPRIFHTILLGMFSVTALLMALVGILGVTAFSVEQRTREIGIRIALGARREEVVGMIVRQGFRLALVGVIVGLVGTLLLGRAIGSLLYEVEPNDPITLVLVVIGLLATAVLACWRPALRASRVHPVTALRHG